MGLSRRHCGPVKQANILLSLADLHFHSSEF